jgi:hypothetical protein
MTQIMMLPVRCAMKLKLIEQSKVLPDGSHWVGLPREQRVLKPDPIPTSTRIPACSLVPVLSIRSESLQDGP